jgi:hypothetical protein
MAAGAPARPSIIQETSTTILPAHHPVRRTVRGGEVDRRERPADPRTDLTRDDPAAELGEQRSGRVAAEETDRHRRRPDRAVEVDAIVTIRPRATSNQRNAGRPVPTVAMYPTPIGRHGNVLRGRPIRCPSSLQSRTSPERRRRTGPVVTDKTSPDSMPSGIRFLDVRNIH